MRLPIVVALVALGLAGTAQAEAGAPDQSHHARTRHKRSRRADSASIGVRRPRSTGGDHEAALTARAPAKPVHSDSIGFPNDGHLEGGAHLDISKPYFRVVPAYATPDVRWGLPVFVDMIDRAAKGVAKHYPGSVLDVGDISQRRGGDLLRHHSHESGRDADLGFYVLDAKGKQQVHAHGFIKFDANLRAEAMPGVRFDDARNWLLIEQLLVDPHARVSHIFIAEPIRQHLLAYARNAHKPQRLLDRAAMTLMQPTNSLPHDDHMHVRISCPHAIGSTCIEIAKNAPRGGRIARRSPPGSHARAVVLKTPQSKAHDPARSVPSLFKAGVVDEPVMHIAPVDDADADSREVKDALDEGGGVRITD